MPGIIKVKCHFCSKQFCKDRGHFNWSKKLGHNLFCSKKCESRYRQTGQWLLCGNNNCKKKFYRSLGDILTFNYCSSSCAAVVNNQKYPKWPAKTCKKCGKVFRKEGSPYCSMECGKLGRFKYTKEEVLTIIRDYHKTHQRVPARRELLDLSGRAHHMFGSWNQTIVEAGLTPNRSQDDRMYKRSKTVAHDGHKCDSISEALIDNWLDQNNIEHERDKSYPSTKHRADWAIKDGKVFLEYFGLANDSPRYDRAVKIKKTLCRKHKIKLIEIYPADLYPTLSLDKKLGTIR